MIAQQALNIEGHLDKVPGVYVCSCVMLSTIVCMCMSSYSSWQWTDGRLG